MMTDCGVYNIKLIVKQLIEALNITHQATREEGKTHHPCAIEIHDNKIYRGIIIMHIGTDNIVIDSNVIHDQNGAYSSQGICR